MIDKIEKIQFISSKILLGFSPTILKMGRGSYELFKRHRDVHRCFVETSKLTNYLFEILKDLVPSDVSATDSNGKLDNSL